MTSSTLQIDQGKLFAACNHDPRLMAVMLTVAELVSGERVEVNFAHPITNGYVEHARTLLLEALGLDAAQNPCKWAVTKSSGSGKREARKLAKREKLS